MPLQFVAGDLFANRYGVQAFAHGCNCQGSMGAGIAKTFRARYEAMYTAYRERCRALPRRLNLGDAWLWREEGQPWVFNLGTQEHYWRGRASYEAIATALAAMRAQADEAGITTIAMPKIGAGYGGLSWRKVRALIEAAFAEWPGTLYVGCPDRIRTTRSSPRSIHRRPGCSPTVATGSAPTRFTVR